MNFHINDDYNNNILQTRQFTKSTQVKTPIILQPDKCVIIKCIWRLQQFTGFIRKANQGKPLIYHSE